MKRKITFVVCVASLLAGCLCSCQYKPSDIQPKDISVVVEEPSDSDSSEIQNEETPSDPHVVEESSDGDDLDVQSEEGSSGSQKQEEISDFSGITIFRQGSPRLQSSGVVSTLGELEDKGYKYCGYIGFGSEYTFSYRTETRLYDVVVYPPIDVIKSMYDLDMFDDDYGQ